MTHKMTAAKTQTLLQVNDGENKKETKKCITIILYFFQTCYFIIKMLEKISKQKFNMHIV